MIRIFLFLIFPFISVGQAQNSSWFKNYLNKMTSEIKFEKVSDSIVSIKDLIPHDRENNVEFFYRSTDDITCVGILNNFFNNKNTMQDIYEKSNQDKYLIVCSYKYKRVILYLNTLNNDSNNSKKIESLGLFMPNHTVYAFVFDFNYNYVGNLIVYPLFTKKKPQIEITKKIKGSYFSRKVESKSGLTFEDFENGLLSQVEKNTSSLLADFRIKSKGIWTRRNNPKLNFFISNWSPIKER